MANNDGAIHSRQAQQRIYDLRFTIYDLRGVFKNAGTIFIAVMLAAFHSVAGLSFRVSPAPEWNHFFQKTNGWIGADAAFSIPLATNKTLWLFGDTFVGDVRDGKRVHARMIHSSIAIQHFGEAPEFFYPTNKNGGPESFMKSPDGKTDFWLMDGARSKRGLFFFMAQMKWINASAFGFRTVGNWLAFVENPDDPPAGWKISRKKVPFDRFADGEKVSFGIATLQT
ncbi:MAG: hypothetical protein ACREFE_03380, partial [Limisphaerales bacterium]